MTSKEMATMAERMAKVEEKLSNHCTAQVIADEKNDQAHSRIEEKVEAIPAKVAELIRDKADKTEVKEAKDNIKEVRGWLWGLLASVVVALAVAIISLLND